MCGCGRFGKKESWLKESCRIWPKDEAIKRIKQKIRDKIGRRYSRSLEEMIAELNPVIRGWNNYHKVRGAERKRRIKLNFFVRERLRIFLRRKYSDRSRGSRRTRDNLFVRLGLCQFG
ncbi:group II intron maturase-specific domain-containing protein [Thermodesulfobacteriota bacterium]